MKRIFLFGVAVFLAVGVPARAHTRLAWSERYPLLPGGSVSVENVQGEILVEGWDRAEVEVRVLKRALGPAARPEEVIVGVEARPGKLKLRTLYPRPSEDPVVVDYRLRVPRQVRLEKLWTVMGNIVVRDIEGTVDARTVSGNIDQSNVSGVVGARAIHGNISVSLRALPESGRAMTLETVNGSVQLLLPPRPSVDLELNTLAGRIESKYAFVASGDPGDRSWRTRVGRGGTRIRLRTVRGDIRVSESDDLL